MGDDFKRAIAHWPFVSPLLTKPQTEADYDRPVMALNLLLDILGKDEAHLLNELEEIINDWIEAYDREHHPMPLASGVDVLRYMVCGHNLTQIDLPGAARSRSFLRS